MIRAEMENACATAVAALTTGYTEEVTWREKSGRKTVERTGSRSFGGLLHQLRLQAADPYATKQGGPTNNPNKSVSRPPVNQAMLDLVDSIDEQADRIVMWLRASVVVCAQPNSRVQMRSPESKLQEIRVMCGTSTLKDAELAQVMQSLSAMVTRCREMLGHDSRRIMLADQVCHVCGGALSVAQDASTDVECMGTPETGPCGVSYARTDWLDLMKRDGE